MARDDFEVTVADLESQDPDSEVEMGDIDSRMDRLEDQLAQMREDPELDASIDSNTLADETQLDES